VTRLLSPTEQAYLNGSRQFSKPQQRYIGYRFKKKLRLMDESRDAAAAQLLRLDNNNDNDNDNNNALVAQPGREKVILLENRVQGNNDDSPSRDSNPGPKVFAACSSSLLERGITKPSLCQAELLGQNKCKFSSSLFNASR
jgi:hypothetical protein